MVKARDEALSDHELARERKQTFGLGLLKGMGVTLKHLFKRNTVIQYPDEKQDLAPRTRGVIALKEENCTVCMLCGRECPDWCIYIDSHKETLPPKREGGRPRKRNVLDRFAIDYALCMYCGICVEVCPYDALFWSREFEYAEYDIRELTHEKERLSDWMATVLPPPPLEEGAEIPGQPAAAATPTVEATGARPATASSSAVEARTEQAKVAPKAGTAAPTDARPTESVPEHQQRAETETVPEPKPAAMATETVERGEPASEADTPTGSRSSTAAPQADTPSAEAAPASTSASSSKSAEASPETTPASSPSDAATSSTTETKPPQADTTPAEASPETTPASSPSDDATSSTTETKPSQADTPSAEAAPAGTSASSSKSAEASPAATGASSTETKSTEDPEAVYQRVLKEQTEKGSSPQVAEARAKVARVKAERGVRTQPAPAPAETPLPSAPTEGRPTEPEPSGAPEATGPTPEPGPVAPTEDESAADASAPTPTAASGPPAPDQASPAAGAPISEESPSAAPDPTAPAAGAQSGGEDPEAAYRRVLAEERAKGSADAVAVARAKAARVRAQRGTSGPGGTS